ncbi:Ser-Thr-rich glycosyl-phosphatidyl-inositol-anchored membrane family-domain-containing protein [Xylariaceae sp. FL0662B]|nr:Ser-Thr-rich glycosyl-phosphatidyl-inositol-anchored membrane family-domain-containing protein [Xylariaceae sp. FL0662B]
MRSSAVFSSVLALAASAFAQTDGYAAMTVPAEHQQVPAGKVFTIKWEAGKYTGMAKIDLLKGKTPTTLEPGNTIASNVDITAGSFDWKVDCALGKDDTYGIKITSASDADTFQYSFPFHIDDKSCASATEGGSGYPTGSAPASESSSASSSSGSSASTGASSSATSSATSGASSSSAPASTSPASSTSPTSQSSSAGVTSASSFPSVTAPVNGSISATYAPSTYAPSTIVTSTSGGPSATSSTTSAPTAGAAKTVGSLAFAGVAALAAFAL